LRDLLQRITQKVGHPEAPTVAIASSASRYFLRQIAEPTLRNLVFVGSNEIPAEVKIVSLGVIQ
jgi:flagellar biosynthesis component FlhA